MNDNQEIKVGLTDGDDSKELQPSCMRGLYWNEQKTQGLIGRILSHPELHDLITHLYDFEDALKYKLEQVNPSDDDSYEQHQLSVVRKLIEITTK